MELSREELIRWSDQVDRSRRAYWMDQGHIIPPASRRGGYGGGIRVQVGERILDSLVALELADAKVARYEAVINVLKLELGLKMVLLERLGYDEAAQDRALRDMRS